MHQLTTAACAPQGRPRNRSGWRGFAATAGGFAIVALVFALPLVAAWVRGGRA